MDPLTDSQKNKKTSALWRGIRGLCPQCGQGQLFKSYLKPNDFCPSCHEDLSNIRADDAPPWLTILITGHIITPLILTFVKHDVFPEWIEMVILFSTATLCIFLILPRAKGLFIALIWQSTQKPAP